MMTRSPKTWEVIARNLFHGSETDINVPCTFSCFPQNHNVNLRYIINRLILVCSCDEPQLRLEQSQKVFLFMHLPILLIEHVIKYVCIELIEDEWFIKCRSLVVANKGWTEEPNTITVTNCKSSGDI